MTIMKSITHQLLDAYGVTRLLRDKAAIILERIARGGGAVSWCVCECEAALDAISARFKPGSQGKAEGRTRGLRRGMRLVVPGALRLPGLFAVQRIDLDQGPACRLGQY
jgi:hypothetical protein